MGGRAVDADSEDLRVGVVELGDISLICLELSRSAWSVGQNKKRQDDIFLASIVAESYPLARMIT